MCRCRMLWLVVVATFGCAGTETENPTEPVETDSGVNTPETDAGLPSAPEGVEFIRSNKSYLSSVDVSFEEQEDFLERNRTFALDLYREIAGLVSADDNILVSPYSISTLMAMTIAGARGATEAEIASALHFAPDQSALHPAMNWLAQILVSSGNEAAYHLEPLNAIWIQKGYQIQDGFLDSLSQHYDTGVFLADLVGDSDETREHINEWVFDNTKGTIEELLPEGSFGSRARVALANAVYFSALWEYPFDEEGTEDGLFTLSNGDRVTLPMMHRQYFYPFAFMTDWRAVALPYKETTISLICVLPNEGEFDAFESGFDALQLDEIVTSLLSRGSVDVRLTIPKFSFESEVDLKEPLSSLGMADAFRDGADFSGISNDDLYISTISHKTHIAIDEIGTVATAATGEVFVVGSIPPSISLNRPFLFFIWDDATKTVLFVGRLVRPDGPVAKPTTVEPVVSDAQAICAILNTCEEREMNEEQCIDSLSQVAAAVLEQCADCYRAIFDSCGEAGCGSQASYCYGTECVDACPDHAF